MASIRCDVPGCCKFANPPAIAASNAAVGISIFADIEEELISLQSISIFHRPMWSELTPENASSW